MQLNNAILFCQVKEDRYQQRAVSAAAQLHPKQDQPAQTEGQGGHIPFIEVKIPPPWIIQPCLIYQRNFNDDG